jgi:predicted membrane protein
VVIRKRKCNPTKREHIEQTIKAIISKTGCELLSQQGILLMKLCFFAAASLRLYFMSHRAARRDHFRTWFFSMNSLGVS